MNKQLLVMSMALAACLVFPSFAGAQDSGSDDAKKKFSGTYVLANSKKKERKKINKKIEKLVDKMSFYKRPFARGELKDSTEPCPKLNVIFSGDDMAINCVGNVKAKSPANGKAVKWVDSDDEEMRLSQKLEKNRMVQKFRSENGLRTNIYRLKDGGKKLVIDVKITSEQLPHPLEYQLVMRRK
ncbi:hypothetical protein FIV42_01040 [Persicimonas caeni]|uniref:Uncharacterized protein n=1 Tax=Persicimonas caeni TaxID=2292766 RepID=A0A4Y6PM48_PERCE|nr:hypothetical protein [Persicimonas caeni]QDG49368.1 hypothetical protein FIV42_01040 [Persicimonas caeni]QED30589.1 hypothetical protein FRD00_01035 [Persicimonas caeni]